jgi:hypothetical protein
LLGFSRARTNSEGKIADDGVGKLFFDVFSKRVSAIEESVSKVLAELEALKLARDRSQISDLVLLERLQTAEGMLVESLEWIKKVANAVGSTRLHPVTQATQATSGPEVSGGPEIQIIPVPRKILLPGGETGSLSSITTPTELQVLALLSDQGPKSAPEIGNLVSRSREHSARLMKKLFEEGYVKRDQSRIPFRYSLVDRVRASFVRSEEKKEDVREEAAAVQA